MNSGMYLFYAVMIACIQVCLQLVISRNVARNRFKDLRRIRMLTTYEIQGMLQSVTFYALNLR